MQFSGTTITLWSLIRGLSANQAVLVVFRTLLGRDPDDNGLAHYSGRMGGSREDQLLAISEIASSDEANRSGLFKTMGADYELIQIDSEQTLCCSMLSSLGVACRRINEQADRLASIESLVRLTLLSVPEYCGTAYDKIEIRVSELEKNQTS